MLVTEATAPRVLERIERSDALVLDTETTGLGTWTGDKVCGVAVKAGGEEFYLPFRHHTGNLPAARLPQLVNAMKGKPIRGFHLRFDLEMMHNEGLPEPPKIEDTLLAAILMNCNELTFALKRNKAGILGLAPRYLGRDTIAAEEALDALLRDRGLSKSEMWKLHPAEVEEYACADLALPERLLEEIYQPGLRNWKMEGVFREYNTYQQALIDMEVRGMPVDRTVVDRAIHENETARESVLAEIQAAAGYPLNPQSWKQVSAWLGTSDAKEKTILASKHPFAQALIDYKAYGKCNASYLQRFIDYSDAAGVLHPQMNLTPDERQEDEGGTRSGRLSGSRPNLQAAPKPKRNPIYSAVRAAIVAPPGYLIGEADYRQAEVWVAGHYSQDGSLFAAYHEGRDLYQEAADALGIDRQTSKILFLAIQYGAGAWKIAEMLGISKEAATRLRHLWHLRFPRIKRAMYNLADLAEKNGAIKLWSGRWTQFDGPTKSGFCKSPYYTAWNRLVQGSVADMVRVAMTRLRPALDSVGGRMLLQVHDSILFLMRADRRDATCRIVQREMEDFPHWDLPAKVDIKVGSSWLDVKEWKEAA